jgi:hypothetical protein
VSWQLPVVSDGFWELKSYWSDWRLYVETLVASLYWFLAFEFAPGAVTNYRQATRYSARRTP